jgi:tetratricopeptide (TPR) repeat protein
MRACCYNQLNQLLSMKKRYVFPILLLLLLFVIISAFVIIKNTDKKEKKKPTSYELLPRKTSLTYTAEWATVKDNASILSGKLKNNPSDIKSLLALAALYIQEGRSTGNFNYYNAAATKLLNDVLEKEANNFEALTFKATILLSQHRFEEGYKIAEQARQMYPLNAYVHGLIVDANVELGNYEAALDAADKMISIRPDIRSYSRIAYLREIHGDIPGAIEAMSLAIDAGAPGDENTEWCRVQMGKLYEQMGKMKEAEMQYIIAVENRKNYPYALVHIAGIKTREKNYTKALALYMQADSLIPDHTFKEGMAEVYNLMGQPAKAKNIADEILVYMEQFSGKDRKESGQNEDHEMAHAYMGVGNYDKALEYAVAEYKRRPANIEVNETVAIVYYEKGEYAKALPYIESALKTNCKNPELLCHAGLIYAKTGDKVKAKKYLEEALKNTPSIPAELEKESIEMLKSLS